MTTVPVVELDERTKEELQPPCSVHDVPALFIFRSRCTGCDIDPSSLACAEHAQKWTAWILQASEPKHRRCGSPVEFVGLEPLR